MDLDKIDELTEYVYAAVGKALINRDFSENIVKIRNMLVEDEESRLKKLGPIDKNLDYIPSLAEENFIPDKNRESRIKTLTKRIDADSSNLRNQHFRELTNLLFGDVYA